jgi:hypothetical protein
MIHLSLHKGWILLEDISTLFRMPELVQLNHSQQLKMLKIIDAIHLEPILMNCTNNRNRSVLAHQDITAEIADTNTARCHQFLPNREDCRLGLRLDS